MQLLICSEAGDQLRGERDLREVRLVSLLQEEGLRCMEPRMSDWSFWQASTRRVSYTSKTHTDIYELRHILKRSLIINLSSTWCSIEGLEKHSTRHQSLALRQAIDIVVALYSQVVS